MAIFRQYIAPLIAVLIFLVSLIAVSARIFLPQDMAAPAPIEVLDQNAEIPVQTPVAELEDEVADLPLTLETLIKGLPTDLEVNTPL
ncbi:MAG: hypothetical protein HC769_27690 [Cyanobacteria bacterium CRU_2_1]|nr:hypothetical protein [Cyanobacteria bacterium RU_5_0]NJR62273.1 hypothetical protein [Cyanobacteria bacterium CRU_2_1]